VNCDWVAPGMTHSCSCSVHCAAGICAGSLSEPIPVASHCPSFLIEIDSPCFSRDDHDTEERLWLPHQHAPGSMVAQNSAGEGDRRVRDVASTEHAAGGSVVSSGCSLHLADARPDDCRGVAHAVEVLLHHGILLVRR